MTDVTYGDDGPHRAWWQNSDDGCGNGWYENGRFTFGIEWHEWSIGVTFPMRGEERQFAGLSIGPVRLAWETTRIEGVSR